MARYERGVYEPEDEIRVFDGSEDDEEAEGSRLPLLIVLALLVLAMFAGVVWLAYTQGVARGRTESPMLAAQTGPTQTGPTQTGQRKTADDSGGTQSPYKGFKIYEQPAPADDEADAPAIASTASPAPPVRAPAEPAPTPSASQPAPQVQIAQAAPAAPPAAPAVKAAAPIIKPAAPPLKKSSAASAEPVSSKPVGPATAPPKRLVAAAPVAASAPPPAKAIATVAAGIALQIGAYKSPEDAGAAWRVYEAKHAAILTGYTEDVQRADLGDKGVWYRLRIIGFSGKDAAGGVCDRLKADGGNCFLAK